MKLLKLPSQVLEIHIIAPLIFVGVIVELHGYLFTPFAIARLIYRPA